MARRGEEGRKEDLRQRRSKQHLMDALLSLLEEKSYRDITVVDICQRAMVHRTTFYAHFEDKNDLLRYVLGQLKDQLLVVRSQAAGQRGDRENVLVMELRKSLDFLMEHKALVAAGLEAEEAVMRIVEEVLVDALRERSEAVGLWGDRPMGVEAASHFYGGAVLSLLHWWIKEDMPISEDELVEQVITFIPAKVAERW